MYDQCHSQLGLCIFDVDSADQAKQRDESFAA